MIGYVWFVTHGATRSSGSHEWERVRVFTDEDAARQAYAETLEGFRAGGLVGPDDFIDIDNEGGRYASLSRLVSGGILSDRDGYGEAEPMETWDWQDEPGALEAYRAFR